MLFQKIEFPQSMDFGKKEKAKWKQKKKKLLS